ncbi:hypothetical protein HanLR1_Chr07g0258291 [Helianthus annuus]|nr:hypothetical protein HanLR1_Chr07g0258291 [Helianthus annuus]
MFATNGGGVVLAGKGQFHIAKAVLTLHWPETAVASVFVQIADVWINLAHVHFTQRNFHWPFKWCYGQPSLDV